MLTLKAPRRQRQAPAPAAEIKETLTCPDTGLAEVAKLRLLDLQIEIDTHQFLSTLPRTFAKELVSCLHRSLFYAIETLHYREKPGADRVELNMAIEGKKLADEQLIDCLKQVIGISRYSEHFLRLCDFVNDGDDFLQSVANPSGPKRCEQRLEKFQGMTRNAMKFAGESSG